MNTVGRDPWLRGSVCSQGQGALGSIPGGLGLRLGTYENSIDSFQIEGIMYPWGQCDLKQGKTEGFIETYHMIDES